MSSRTRPFLIDGVASVVAKLRPDPRLFTVVTFHRVLPEEHLAEYPLPEIAVTPSELDWILCHLRARYDVGPLAAQHARWLAGETGRPLLAISFDDGQRDNYLHARPVLEDLGLRASFFVVARAIGGRRPLWHDRVGYGLARDPDRRETPLSLIEAMKARPEAERAALADSLDGGFPSWDGFMRWEELRAMAEAGHEIGSHSMSHALLPGCDDAGLRVEIAESRRLLEARLGRDVETFCYPNNN